MAQPRRPRQAPPQPPTSLPQLRALASTVRQDIVDTLQALGTASVPELAAHMDRAPDSLYYHVRALLKAGLLVRLPETRRRGNHQEALYCLPGAGTALRLNYRPGRTRGAKALGELVGNMLRASQREFEAAIARPDCVTEGPRRELWAGRSKGWLSAQDLERCNALLAEVAGLLSSVRSPERDRLFTLQFLLAPARRTGSGGRDSAKASRAASPSPRRRSP